MRMLLISLLLLGVRFVAPASSLVDASALASALLEADARVASAQAEFSWPFPPAEPPPFAAFTDFTHNASATFGEWSGVEASGALEWPGLARAAPAAFIVLKSLLSPEEADALVRAVEREELDADADTVDGAPTRELYLERSGSAEGVRGITGKADADAAAGAFEARRAVSRRGGGARLLPAASVSLVGDFSRGNEGLASS
jgi:hypothetical protein